MDEVALIRDAKSHYAPVFRGREFHAFDAREVVGEMQIGTIENIGRLLQHGVLVRAL